MRLLLDTHILLWAVGLSGAGCRPTFAPSSRIRAIRSTSARPASGRLPSSRARAGRDFDFQPEQIAARGG